MGGDLRVYEDPAATITHDRHERGANSSRLWFTNKDGNTIGSIDTSS